MNNFQLNIKNWSGADLSDRSFRQIHSGNLQRRLAQPIQPIGSNLTGANADMIESPRNKEDREVTLFENELIICNTVSTTLISYNLVSIRTIQNEEGEKLIENRIDLNHVTIIFDHEDRRIKIETHTKKCTKSIQLYAENDESFEQWKSKIEEELKYSDPNQNKENGPFHVSTVGLYQLQSY